MSNWPSFTGAPVRLRSAHPLVKFELHEMISVEMSGALARKSIDVANMRPISGSSQYKAGSC